MADNSLPNRAQRAQRDTWGQTVTVQSDDGRLCVTHVAMGLESGDAQIDILGRRHGHCCGCLVVLSGVRQRAAFWRTRHVGDLAHV